VVTPTTLAPFRAVVPEAAWRAGVPADVADHLPATARPLPADPAASPPATTAGGDAPTPDSLAAAARLLAGAPIRLHGMAARGEAGIVFALASNLSAAASVVRRARSSGDPEATIALAPDPEVGLVPAEQLVSQVLRLLPAPDEARADALPDATPVTCAPEVATALVRALREDDQPVVRELCAQLGVDEPPALLASLTQLRGEFTLVLSAPGSPSRLLRLLLGTDGWVETSATVAGVHHRRIGLEDLRGLLVDEVAAAAERLARSDDAGGRGGTANRTGGAR